MILARTAIEAAIVTIDGYVAAGRSDVVDLRFDRGQLLELLGRPAEAMRDYVAVIAADPLHVNALNALGLAFLGDGHRALARTMLEAAVTHGPQHAAARANLGYVELVDGRVDEASRLYEAALRIDPMLAVAHHGLSSDCRTNAVMAPLRPRGMPAVCNAGRSPFRAIRAIRRRSTC